MKQPLRIAAISGIILLVISFLWGLLSNFILDQNILTILSSIFLVSSTILSILFTYGFVVLARMYKAKLLLVMAWIAIIVGLIFFVLIIFMNILTLVVPVSAQISAEDINNFNQNPDISALIDVETGQLTEFGKQLMYVFIIFWIVFSVIVGAYMILFGVGLLKLKKDVKYSYISGILNIISGATFIFFIGLLVGFVALIFEIIMLFKASDKLEIKR
jgi:hypothetical protein